MPMPHAHSLTRRALLGGIAATTATAAATALLVPAFAGTAIADGPAATRSLLREKPAPSLEILTDILQRLPGNLVTLDDPPIPFTFADVQAQYTALGIPAFTEWDGTPEQFRMYGNATSMLPLGQVGAFLYTADEEFLAAIGFNPLATHQALQVGLASGAVMAFRGGFDPEGVVATLEASGYAPMTTITGQPAWSNGPDGEFSPMDPIQRRTVGAMNNAFVLDDEWLVFSRTLATLDAIAAFAAATTENSVFAAPGVSETIAMLNDETVSVLALRGDMLTPEMTFPPEDAALPEALAASDATTGPLPAASLLAMAVTAGIRPLADGEDAAALEDVVVQALLAMTSPADAEAAAEIVAARWDALSSTVTSGPYTDLLTIDTAEAVGTVAAFDFTIAGPPSAWFRLIDNRDWLPFVTTGA